MISPDFLFPPTMTVLDAMQAQADSEFVQMVAPLTALEALGELLDTFYEVE